MQFVVDSYRMWFERTRQEYTTYIELVPAKDNADDGDSVSQVRLQYSDLNTVGSDIIGSGGTQLVAFAPLSSLEYHRHLLQTEKPVFFIWYYDSDQPSQLSYWALGVPGEPTGEGEKDESP
jgi:hypothetical protein